MLVAAGAAVLLVTVLGALALARYLAPRGASARVRLSSAAAALAMAACVAGWAAAAVALTCVPADEQREFVDELPRQIDVPTAAQLASLGAPPEPGACGLSGGERESRCAPRSPDCRRWAHVVQCGPL